MSKTTSHFALSPQGVPSRTKKQRPDPNRDFRAESHYGSAFFITSYYPFNLLLVLQSLPPPSHLRDGSACPGSRTRSNGHLSGSTCPTPPSWEYPGRGGHRSRSPFSSGDRATLHPTFPPPKISLFLPIFFKG